MATISHREHKAPISFIISMQGFIWKTFHIAPSLKKWSNQIVSSRLLQIQGSLVQVKIVREWSNQKLVCGSPKVMTIQMLTSSHHEQLGHIGKGGRERVWAQQLEREWIQKCAFSFCLSPCLHHLFGFFFDFSCPLALPLHFTFSLVSHVSCTLPFTSNFPCI